MRTIWVLGTSVVAIGCGSGQTGDERHTAVARAPLEQPGTAAALDSGTISAREIALGDSVFNGATGAGICSTCHGGNGVGTEAAPSLSDRYWINGDGSLGFIQGIVYQGVQQPRRHPLPMPAFGRTLTERQLRAVAAYVYALSHDDT